MATTNRLYQGAYRSELEEEDTPGSSPDSAVNTEEQNPLSPEEANWKKRYGDAKTHINQLTERNKSLETQLHAASKQEVKIPSTTDELNDFARKYPDVYRHIRSIALTELLSERENLVRETETVKEDLESIKLERGLQKILSKHSDFHDINNSKAFHVWAELQPKEIQNWLFENSDPDLCIKAIDLYKTETNFKKATPKPRADVQVRTKSAPPELDENEGGKRIWKASEIGKLNAKAYDKFEAEIEAARREGRIDLSA